MAIKSARWTRHELERFPKDGNRYEVLDGDLLVTPQPAPDHQAVAVRLTVALYTYCMAHNVGLALSPASLRWGKNELQPDIEVIPGYRFGTGETWESAPRPILVVEVLSPGGVSRRRDLSIKKDAYLRLGVGTYWVVDQEARRVHAWSDPVSETILTDALHWQPKPDAPAFEMRLDELFASPGD